MEVVSILLGFSFLAVGGEYLVRSAVGLAQRLGLPSLLIGITIVAAATSAPELFVSIRSALGGATAIAIGNVVGSNIANLAFGLGTMGLIAPFAARRNALHRDVRALLIVTVVFLALGLTGSIGRVAGAAMVAGLVVYLWLSYREERKRRTASAAIHAAESEEFGTPWKLPVAAAVLVASVAALLLGADLLVDGAVSLARAWGVSDAVIGVTVVAIGTSLPELATTMAAAREGEHDVALGNLVGSSIFNLLAIIGLTALIMPVPTDRVFIMTSGVVMLATTLLCAPVLTGKWRVTRAGAAGLVAAYAAYIVLVALL